MPKVHLTDISVRRLQSTERQVTFWDTQLPGFGIRLGRNRKTWTILRGTTRERVSVGHYPDLSLQEARREAKRLLIEPTQPRSATFDKVLDQFLATHCEQNHRPRTRKEIERLLRKHFLPALRKTPLSEISAPDITSIVDKLSDAPSEAAHAFKAVRTMLRWARGRHIKHNPLEGISRPAADRQRERVLTDPEIKAVWNVALSDFEKMIRLLLLTGARKSEIASLRWEWIEGKTLTIPGAFTKNRRTHRIPLGAMSLELIAAIDRGSAYLFPGRWDANTHFHEGSWGKLKKSLDESSGVTDWVIHDLRRTFATNLAALSVPIHVTEKLLNHVSGTTGGLVAVYQRHQFWDEQVAAIDAWENKLTTLLNS